ncbi:MAG: DUF4352 domain-containing protein [Coriobacteriales bacterium]|jgi:hypothetical protein|nr:DUF4352 domain-containing protein [Coriobacteriales bacterium]
MMGKRENKNRGSRIIRSIAAIVAALLACSLVACDTQNDITRMLQSEGRPYNNVTTGKVGDTLTNTFFEWTVNSVTTEESLMLDGEEVSPNTSGYKFVLVDITTKNIFDQPNPMGNFDFTIIWNEGEDTTEDTPYSQFMDDMYPDEFTQAVGDSTNGILVFEVPSDVTSAIIAYYEIWSDEFEGDTYLFEVKF